MIKVGSRVKFLHSTEAGVVSSIKDNMAYVDVDGFDIPVLLSDIVDVPIEAENAAIIRIGPDDPKAPKSSKSAASVRSGHAYGKVTIEDNYEDEEVIDISVLKNHYASQITNNILTANQNQPSKIEAAPYEDTGYVVKLAFVPVGKGNPETLDLDAYLVNDSGYEINYCIGIWRHNYVETLKFGKLDTDTKELIKGFSRASFAQIQTLHVSLQPFKPVNFVPQITENFDIELHPLKFIRKGNYVENDYFPEPAFLFSLSGNNEVANTPQIEEPQITRKDSDYPKTKPITNSGEINSPQIEDLHIESIMDSFENLLPGEILNTQISRFQFVLETAIRNNQKGKLVFIHGVGKGKLKYEMKKILDKEYSKLRYQDASFAEYGYGAIMVFL